MVIVVASIMTKPGKRSEFLEIFKANVPNVLAEDGCIEYAPTVDVESDVSVQLREPQVVTIVEKWRDMAALKAHFTAPHMLEYRKKVQDLTEGSVLRLLQPV